jgi:hypothetical protein
MDGWTDGRLFCQFVGFCVCAGDSNLIPDAVIANHQIAQRPHIIQLMMTYNESYQFTQRGAELLAEAACEAPGQAPTRLRESPPPPESP